MAYRHDKYLEARLRAISATSGAVMSKPTGHVGGGKTSPVKGKARAERARREYLRAAEAARQAARLAVKTKAAETIVPELTAIAPGLRVLKAN